MTKLSHGHGQLHAYVTAGEDDPHTKATVIGHGHGSDHAYVTRSPKTASSRPGWADGDFTAKNGDLYHTVTENKAVTMRTPTGAMAGYVNWGDNDVIGNMNVREEHQRKGIATELLRRAREQRPELQHSDRLSGDAQAWLKGIGERHGSLKRCPCGMAVEFDPSDGWQHADGSISHDGEFYGKSVSDLVKTAAAGPNDPVRWQHRQKNWDTKGHEFAPIEQTKQVGSVTLHAERPVDEDGDRMIHAVDHDGTYVGQAYYGNHPSRPGHIELVPEVHPEHRRRGIGTELYNYAEELSGKPSAPASSHSADAAAFWHHRQAKRWMPSQRLFGPTHGLDHRLFDGDRLRPEVREYILTTLDGFWKPVYGPDWQSWARVYFAGSEASEWTSETLEGNNDFDVLVGVDYDGMRVALGGLIAMMSDEQLTAGMNQQFRELLNPRTAEAMIVIEGKPEGPFENTWFVNKDSYDIRRIRPYAAYDVGKDEWAVKPPRLPDWDISKFPEGKGLVNEIHGIVEMAKGVLKMPEPFRTQNGSALWEFVHGNRSNAFGEQGEGWFDPRNVIEKALDQAGLMQKLWALHDRAQRDPATLNSPAGWSNDPVTAEG